MKENKISIVIDKPVAIVFDFTINPSNTPKWIDHLIKEETNEYPPRIGTIYRNRGLVENWDEYYVSEIKENLLFELTSKDGVYHVRYNYKPLSENQTEMEYYEWMNEGELGTPFSIEVLEKLKAVVEEM